jgi:tetratricopeptide (TPR) repeat protein
MAGVSYCPIVGNKCNQEEPDLRVHPWTFFLAEPFQPKEERQKREYAIKSALRIYKNGKFSKKSLRVADEEPNSAMFCDICRMIQSSSHGMADISGLNPNVLLELGMMIALGKPVIILIKKTELHLKDILPSDILWKRVIPYGEFLEITQKLEKELQNIPNTPVPKSAATSISEVIAEKNPQFAEQLKEVLQEIVKTTLGNFSKAMEELGLNGDISTRKVKLANSDQEKIEEIFEKVKQQERLVGYPKNASSSFLKGNLLANQGKYEQALEMYNLVLDFEPDNPNILLNKAIALTILGRKEEAKNCYEQMTKSKPKDPTGLLKKGIAYDKLGKPEEAIPYFYQAKSLKMNQYDVCYNMGIAHNMLGHHNKALKYYEEATDLKPKAYGAWFNRGFCLWILCRNNEAIESLEKAISLDKETYRAWFIKGLVLIRMGKFDEAIDCLQQATKLNPEDASIWYNMGTAFKKKGNFVKEIECYNNAINIDSKKMDAWSNKGVALDRMGQHDQAIKCYETALKIEPNNDLIMVNFAEELFVVNDVSRGLELARKVAKIAQNDDTKTISLLLTCLGCALLNDNTGFENARRQITGKYLMILGICYDFKNVEKMANERLPTVMKSKMLQLISRAKEASSLTRGKNSSF